MQEKPLHPWKVSLNDDLGHVKLVGFEIVLEIVLVDVVYRHENITWTR